MKSISADGTIIYISFHRWSKYDKVPCLGAQAGVRIRNVMIAAQRSDSQSNALTSSAISAPLLLQKDNNPRLALLSVYFTLPPGGINTILSEEDNIVVNLSAPTVHYIKKS